MTEAMRPEPEDSYGIAKYAVERELAVTHEMFGLELRDLPPAQRLRRAPEHRRPLPQRASASSSTRSCRTSRCRSSATASRRAPSRHVDDIVPAIAERRHARGAWQEIVQRRRRHAVHGEPARRRRAPRDGRAGSPDRAPRRAQRGEARLLRPLEAARRSSGDLPRSTSRRASSGWWRGHGSTARARHRRSQNIEIMKNLPPSWLDT